MIVASVVVAFAIGSLLGRLYSYVALLLVSPLIALSLATISWKGGAGVATAAFVGLGAMALAQVGFLLGVVLDPSFRAGRPASGSGLARRPAKPRPSSLPER